MHTDNVIWAEYETSTVDNVEWLLCNWIDYIFSTNFMGSYFSFLCVLKFMMCPFKCRCNKFFISNPTRLLFSERVHSLEIHNYVLHEFGRDLFAKCRETRFPCCGPQIAQIGDYGDVLSCQYRWQNPWSKIHTHVMGLLLTSAPPRQRDPTKR